MTPDQRRFCHGITAGADGQADAPGIGDLLDDLDASLGDTGRLVRALSAVSDTAAEWPILSGQRLAKLVVRHGLLGFELGRLLEAVEPHRGARVAAEPRVIRRAVAYIEAHAAGAVTLADISGEAGVGPRALQQAFRRHRDTTPLGYLRAVRYQRAHEDLQMATSLDSVGEIARRWGFIHVSHFSAGYRRRYGQTPRTTLNT